MRIDDQHPSAQTAAPVIRLAAIYRTLGLAGDPFPRIPTATDRARDLFAPLAAMESATRDLRAWLADGEACTLAVITGADGSGRTTLIRQLVTTLSTTPGIAPIAIALDDDKVTDVRLLRAITTALAIETTARTGLELVNVVRAQVATLRERGILPVLIVDDIDIAGTRLEILRSLLTPPDAAMPAEAYDLRIVLTGGDDLRERLQRRRALAHRIAVHATLTPLASDEIATVLAQRIAAFRLGDATIAPPAFTEEALAIVTTWSVGNLTAVIHLAGECLLEAIARGSQDVTGAITHDVARDLTNRARERARAEADAPYLLPAVQTRLALSFAEADVADEHVPDARPARRSRSRKGMPQ